MFAGTTGFIFIQFEELLDATFTLDEFLLSPPTLVEEHERLRGMTLLGDMSTPGTYSHHTGITVHTICWICDDTF